MCSVPQRCINKVRRLWRNTPGSLPLNYIVNFKLFLQSPFQYNFFAFSSFWVVKKSYESYTDFMCVFYVFFHLNVVIGKVELKKGSMQVLVDQKGKNWGNMFFSLLQLDANLFAGEPYNRLARKNKRRLKWREKIQIYRKYGKPVSKPAKTNSVSVGPGPVSMTHRYFKNAHLYCMTCIMYCIYLQLSIFHPSQMNIKNISFRS